VLNLQTSFSDPDLAYRTIAEAHRDLTERESAALNAALVLLLANHIGDLQVLAEALKLAHQLFEPRSDRVGPEYRF
jgi:hypothetical protein